MTNDEKVQIYEGWLMELLDQLPPATQQSILDMILYREQHTAPADHYEIVDNEYIHRFIERLKIKDWLK